MTAMAHFGNESSPPSPLPPCKLPSVGDVLGGEAEDEEAADADRADAELADAELADAEEIEANTDEGGDVSNPGRPATETSATTASSQREKRGHTDGGERALMDLSATQRLTMRNDDKVVAICGVLTDRKCGRSWIVSPPERNKQAFPLVSKRNANAGGKSGSADSYHASEGRIAHIPWEFGRFV
jgi:hypothetical protein